MVGPEGSGKTTLLARVKGEDVTGIEPTIGLQVSGTAGPTSSEWSFCINCGFRTVHTACHVYIMYCEMKFGNLYGRPVCSPCLTEHQMKGLQEQGK